MALDYSRSVENTQFRHVIFVSGEGTGERAQAVPESAALLLFAHALLNAMPSEGLQDAFHSLHETFQYYSYRPLRLLTAPSRERVNAKVGSVRIQPAFRVPDE